MRLLPCLRGHARALAVLAAIALLLGPAFGATRPIPAQGKLAQGKLAQGTLAQGTLAQGFTVVVCTAEGLVTKRVGDDNAPPSPGRDGPHCTACLGRDVAFLPPGEAAPLPAAPGRIVVPAVPPPPLATSPSPHLRPAARAPPTLA